MNVETTLESNAQLAETGKPGMRALDYPAMPSALFLVFHTATSDTSRDGTLLQVTPTASKVVALVGMQFARALRGWSFRPGTAGLASSVDSNAIESCRWAPVTVAASGMPRASTTMCRFVPSLPRSVGLGLVCAPPGAGNAGAIDARPLPINLVMLPQPAQPSQIMVADGIDPWFSMAPCRIARGAGGRG